MLPFAYLEKKNKKQKKKTKKQTKKIEKKQKIRRATIGSSASQPTWAQIKAEAEKQKNEAKTTKKGWDTLKEAQAQGKLTEEKPDLVLPSFIRSREFRSFAKRQKEEKKE